MTKWLIGLTSLLLPLAGWADVSASDLIQISGATAGDNFARQIKAGDLNGDGYEDLILGTYGESVNGSQTGAVHILYGTTEPFTTSSITNTADVTYYGEVLYDWAGMEVSAGDVNGDGYDDLLMTAMQNGDGATTGGAVYLVYGQAEPLAGGNLNTTIQFVGAQVDEYVGYDAAMVGDLNADGYDDIMIGAPYNDTAGADAGAVYVIYGRASAFTSATLASLASVIYADAAGDHLGDTVIPAGDLNADGYDDALIGGDGIDTPVVEAGAMYLIYGSATVIAQPSTASQFVRFTGENSMDYLGYEAAALGDVNADGYDDLLIACAFYGASNTGAVYIIYGQASQWTSGSVGQGVRITGLAAQDYFGNNVGSAGDFNGDGYDDILVAAPYADDSASEAGTVYMINGQASQFTAGSISSLSPLLFTGEAASQLFGSAVRGVDLNGDGYPELLASATNNSEAAPTAGALYIAYLRIDLDEDGTLGSGGLLATGTDCNDADGTVVENQTYYLDVDGDGLGVDTTTTSVCTSIPPDGYADNANDTDDTIKNDGVEIDNDEIDNDGDGEVDEANTKSENDAHPEYGSYDPLDEAEVAAALVSVRAKKNGKVQVRYADDSVYVYTVFKGVSGKPTIKQYPDLGYYVALDKAGRKLALLNVLNGTVIERGKLKRSGYRSHHLQFADLRSDGKQDVVIASQRGQQVRVAIAQVNVTKQKFQKRDQVVVTAVGAKLNRTTVVANTIDIRNAKTAIANVFVTKRHQLVWLP